MIDQFTLDEGLSAIKQFFSYYSLTLQNEELFDKLNQDLAGFPLNLYQVLKKIRTRAKLMEVGEPIDNIVRNCIEIGAKEEEKYSEKSSEKKIDDPILRKLSLILKKAFEMIEKPKNIVGGQEYETVTDGKHSINEDKVGLRKATERLFYMMSLLDNDHLYQEMFLGIKDDKKKEEYERGLENLRNVGLFHYENR